VADGWAIEEELWRVLSNPRIEDADDAILESQRESVHASVIPIDA
jgi:hypothetical protein